MSRCWLMLQFNISCLLYKYHNVMFWINIWIRKIDYTSISDLLINVDGFCIDETTWYAFPVTWHLIVARLLKRRNQMLKDIKQFIMHMMIWKILRIISWIFWFGVCKFYFKLIKLFKIKTILFHETWFSFHGVGKL